MRRVLALILAVGLVGGALVVRRALDDDRDVGADTVISPVLTEEVRVVCPTEIADACNAVDGVAVTIEDAGDTVGRLTDPDLDPATAGIDAWVIPAPWVGLTEQLAGAAAGDGPLAAPSEVVARSELVILGWDERLSWLEAHCSEVSWRCIGDVAGVPWVDIGGGVNAGSVQPGHRSPVDSAIGLLTVGSIAADYFGGGDFSSNQIDASFRRWFGNFEAAFEGNVGTSADPPVNQMLRVGPALYDFVGATRVEADEAIALESRDGDDLRIVAGPPVATADLVVVAVSGAPGEQGVAGVTDDIGAALLDAGWSAPDAAGLAADSGLPSDGVLLALRMLWEVVTE